MELLWKNEFLTVRYVDQHIGGSGTEYVMTLKIEIVRMDFIWIIHQNVQCE